MTKCRCCCLPFKFMLIQTWYFLGLIEDLLEDVGITPGAPARGRLITWRTLHGSSCSSTDFFFGAALPLIKKNYVSGKVWTERKSLPSWLCQQHKILKMQKTYIQSNTFRFAVCCQVSARKASMFHLLGWGVPSSLPVIVLVVYGVEANELLDMFHASNQCRHSMNS
jgi:hypothetical protein